ncbi:HNH endonuclease signature motif containing protein [soil metagenome]
MEVVDHLRVASAALDAALLVDSPLAGVEVAELIRLNRSLITKAESLGLRLTFTADKSGVARREGAASTAAFVAITTGVSLSQAAREVKLAHDLQRVASATREALVRPGMSKDKMGTLTTALNKLPKNLPAADRQRVEDDLVGKAASLSLEDFRRAANRALEVIDAAWADQVQGEELAAVEKAARKDAMFWMDAPNEKGLVKGGFLIPVIDGAILKNMLESLTSPKQDQYLTDPAEIGPEVDYVHKLGRAFCQLLERYPAEDVLPFHGGMPAVVVINADHDKLVTGIGTAVIANTGDPISIKELRRVGCEARILPQIMGTKTITLDMGRDERLHNKHHRLSLTAKYGGCAFPDCHAPPTWCDIHHVEFWKNGGSTTLADGIPLCKQHHNLIHDEEWQARVASDGWAEFTPPRYIDRQQKPRRCTRYRPRQTA